MDQQGNAKSMKAREPMSAQSTYAGVPRQAVKVREYKFIHWVPPDLQPSHTEDSLPPISARPPKKPLSVKSANSVQKRPLPQKATPKVQPAPAPVQAVPLPLAPAPSPPVAVGSTPAGPAPPNFASAPDAPRPETPSTTLNNAADPIAYHPFPIFGRSYLEQVLRWWWYPLEANSVPTPLREWTKEQKRASGGQWKQAELIIRGWHILKGHELLPIAADQAQALELDELEADVKEWKARWGESVEVGRIKIREYLRNHDPPYEWAPAKRNRWTAGKPCGSVPAKRDRSSLRGRGKDEAADETAREEAEREEEAKRAKWGEELMMMPGMDWW